MQNSLLLDGTIEEFTNPANPKRIQFIMNTKTRLAASMGVSLNSVNVNIETQGPPTSSQETGTTGRRRLFGGLSFLASSGTYSTVYSTTVVCTCVNSASILTLFTSSLSLAYPYADPLGLFSSPAPSPTPAPAPAPAAPSGKVNVVVTAQVLVVLVEGRTEAEKAQQIADIATMTGGLGAYPNKGEPGDSSTHNIQRGTSFCAAHHSTHTRWSLFFSSSSPSLSPSRYGRCRDISVRRTDAVLPR